MFIKFKLIAFLFATTLFSISCEQFSIEPDTKVTEQVFPESIDLVLPSAISSDEVLKSVKALSGKGIHNYLRNFVHIGQQIVKTINKTYQRIISINPEGLLEYSYTGLDGKTKYVSIKDSVLVGDKLWDYQMEIYDNSFSNLALQVFWNNNTNEQLITCKPNLLNHDEMEEHPDAKYIIMLNTELSLSEYEQTVYIGISGLAISEQNLYAPNNMKLFFGLNNNIIDLIGSSNNPNVTLYDTDIVGKNWSFRGKTDIAKNLAVLELALPYPELENIEDMMNNFSIREVILQELKSVYDYSTFSDEEILADKNIIAANIESPSFFNSNGFQSAGANTPTEYSHLNNFSELIPFIPLEVKTDEVDFISFVE